MNNTLQPLTPYTTKLKQNVSTLFSGPLAGAGWMLLACIMFTALAVVIRLASPYLSIFEIVFYRNMVTLCIASVSLMREGLSPRTPNWRWFLLLGLAAVSSNLTYGYGLAHLPFSTANVLNYTHPIFLVILGVVLFRLSVERPVVIALLCAFLGVILLLQPKSLPPEQWNAGMIALISGIIAGLLNLLIYHLGVLGEPSPRLLWYFGAFSMTITGCVTFYTEGFHPLHGILWLFVAMLGLFSASAQFLLVRAFRSGSPNITSLFSYSTILYAVILDIFVFQKQHFNIFSSAGILLILGSGLLVTWFNPSQRIHVQKHPS